MRSGRPILSDDEVNEVVGWWESAERHIDWLNDEAWKNSKPNSLDISFQNGPIKEHGINGVTQEALLAIVIDRLRSFQAGPFACSANESALDHCVVALKDLQRRTRDRIARGVEGKSVA